MPTRDAAVAATHLAPEAHILLLTAAPAEYDDELRSLLQGDVNWSLLLHLAWRERAAAVLWRRLVQLELTDLNEAAADTLRRQALVAAFRQEYLEGRLARVLDMLNDAGFQVLLLKGAALAMTAYESFRDRPMGDIDLLLPEDQVGDAHALLLESGWERETPSEDERFYADHHHLAPLKDPRVADAVLEVHRDLFPGWSPTRLALPEVWERARVVEWRGRQVHVPALTHALLHVCIHYAWSHMMYRGTWRAFSDLHAILGGADVDWEEFCEAAIQARASTCCFWTLRLAARYGAAPVPAAVLDVLRPPGSERILDSLERHLAANLLPSDRGCPSSLLFNRMWSAAIRPGWSGHGSIRPWHEEPRRRVADPSGLSRVRSHTARLAHWRRYISTVLKG